MLPCPRTHHLPCLPPMDFPLQTGTGEARALGAGSRNRPEKARPAQSWVLLSHLARLVATCQGTGVAWTLPEALSCFCS